MRNVLKTIINPTTLNDEWQFYRRFTATRFDGLSPQGGAGVVTASIAAASGATYNPQIRLQKVPLAAALSQ